MPCLVWIEILKDRDLARRGKKQSSQDAQQQAMSDAAQARAKVEQAGDKEGQTRGKDQSTVAKPKDEAGKLVKKKPNPYLPTIEHKHRNHAQP